MKSDIIDIDVAVEGRTKLAVLVHTGNKEDEAVWLPFSQIEIEESNAFMGIYTITIPEWLALERGLI